MRRVAHKLGDNYRFLWCTHTGMYSVVRVAQKRTKNKSALIFERYVSYLWSKYVSIKDICISSSTVRIDQLCSWSHILGWQSHRHPQSVMRANHCTVDGGINYPAFRRHLMPVGHFLSTQVKIGHRGAALVIWYSLVSVCALQAVSWQSQSPSIRLFVWFLITFMYKGKILCSTSPLSVGLREHCWISTGKNVKIRVRWVRTSRDWYISWHICTKSVWKEAETVRKMERGSWPYSHPWK